MERGATDAQRKKHDFTSQSVHQTVHVQADGKKCILLGGQGDRYGDPCARGVRAGTGERWEWTEKGNRWESIGGTGGGRMDRGARVDVEWDTCATGKDGSDPCDSKE